VVGIRRICLPEFPGLTSQYRTYGQIVTASISLFYDHTSTFEVQIRYISVRTIQLQVYSFRLTLTKQVNTMKSAIALFLIFLLSIVSDAQSTYKSIDLEEYAVGDTITFGYGSPLESKYTSIKYNGTVGDTIQPFRAMPKIPNTKAVIKRIYTGRHGEVSFETLSPSGYYYRIPVDRAILKSELKSKNPSFRTSEEATKELKKAKEKLDLGLISKEEYEGILTELKKYIKD